MSAKPLYGTPSVAFRALRLLANANCQIRAPRSPKWRSATALRNSASSVPIVHQRTFHDVNQLTTSVPYNSGMPTPDTTRHRAPLAHVLESCLYAADLEAAERFYVGVLGLVLHGKQPGRHVFLRCGQRMVLVFNPAESSKPATHNGLDVPVHGTTGAGHLCFAVPEQDLASWQAHLAQHGIPIEKIIDWPGGGRSLYFRDPAGNSLEIATPRIWGIADE